MLVKGELIPTEKIGIVETKGNYALVAIPGMDLKPVMIDQEKFNKISQSYDNESIRMLMLDALKGKDEKEK